MQHLRNYLQDIGGPIPQTIWEEVEAMVQILEVKRNEEIHHIATHCHHLWYIEQGAVKSYEYGNGQEVVTDFFIEHKFFTDFASILSQKVSEMGFRATEDSVIYRLPYAELLKLYERFHRFEHIGRILVQRDFLREYQLRKLHLRTDASQRYQFLIEHFPHLFQRFALKDIAGFIGITPESLSRLRKLR